MKISRSIRRARARKQLRSHERKYSRPEGEWKEFVPIAVEAAFDECVRQYGGEKIEDRLPNPALRPLNADYIFPKHNVIAELKTIEGALSGREGIRSLVQAYIDTGHSPSEVDDVIFRGTSLPERVSALLGRRLRRSIERRITKARKQLRHSRSMFGDQDTGTIIIFAMDEPPLFGHRLVLNTIASIIIDNYNDDLTDGWVYMNPNTQTRMAGGNMEFAGWYPFYRTDEVNLRLRELVDPLGSAWLQHCAARTENKSPILKLDSLEAMLAALGED